MTVSACRDNRCLAYCADIETIESAAEGAAQSGAKRERVGQGCEFIVAVSSAPTATVVIIYIISGTRALATTATRAAVVAILHIDSTGTAGIVYRWGHHAVGEAGVA